MFGRSRVSVLAPALLGALVLVLVPVMARAADSAAEVGRKQLNPTGLTAGSPANGDGNLKVSLSNRSDGQILVTWKRPTKVSNLKKFTVTTASNLRKFNNVRVVTVSRRKESVILPHTATATPDSGNFTFVQVTVHRKTGHSGSSPTKWIQAPLGADCLASDQVTVGTFNVRGWHLNSKDSPYAWKNRRPRVLSTIMQSGAGAVALQEAGGPAGEGYGDQRQWQDVVDGLNARSDSSGRWVNVFDETYPGGGLVGTRLIFDQARFAMVDSEVQKIAVLGAPNAWAPWVRLRDRESGAEFYLISVHLRVGDTLLSHTVRGLQAAQVVGLSKLLSLSGKQVIVAGDFNSTVNTKPNNNVQAAMLTAGFYDAFATRSLVHPDFGTGNNFNFPVKRSPYRRDYIMSLGSQEGSCRYENMAYTKADHVASDHFMQVATLPVG